MAAFGGVYWWRARSSTQSQGDLQQRAQRASLECRRFPGGLQYPTISTYQANWGDTLQLDRWLGKRPMVVNAWVSWCAPCRREVPLLQEAWAEQKDDGRFVGIDPRGTAQKSLPIMGVPDTFFIDKQGRIVYERIGELTAGQLRKGLARLAQPPAR